jgi:hypothetical protein
MILTREVILRELAAGRLAIDPLADDQIGPASIDLHLGDEIRVMESGGEEVAVTEEADCRTIHRPGPHAPHPARPFSDHAQARAATRPGRMARGQAERAPRVISTSWASSRPGVDSRQVLEM